MTQSMLRDRLLDCVIPEEDAAESEEEESRQEEVDKLLVKQE